VEFRCNVTTFGVTIIFEWDPAKNLSNIQKHGFDFSDAEELFRGLLVVDPDVRQDYGETRWTGIGMIRGRPAHVVITEQPPQIIRIISLRKATRREQKQYEEAIQDRLEAD
jgi:hypothetical protein